MEIKENEENDESNGNQRNVRSMKEMQSGEKKTTEAIAIEAEGKVKAHARAAIEALRANGSKEKTVVFVGVGTAVGKTISVAEMVKRVVKGLHQCTSYAPVVVKELKDGKLKASKATQIRIELSTTAEGMDTNAPGYQAPKSRSGSVATSPRAMKPANMLSAASPKRHIALPLKKKIAKAFTASTNREVTPTA